MLCLHTLRADCNRREEVTPRNHFNFASTRSVQIATVAGAIEASITPLCLHTLRADCNRRFCSLSGVKTSLPPHAPCRLQQDLSVAGKRAGIHLCLHTLRADCNGIGFLCKLSTKPLPPHAPCRLQPAGAGRTERSITLCLHTLRADCNRSGARSSRASRSLCLHTLRADCNLMAFDIETTRLLCLHTLRADCNGRNAQNCNIHFSERVLSR